MKFLIGILITVLALMILPISGWTGDKEDRQFKKINQGRCKQGDQKACDALRIITDIDNCSNPKMKHLAVSTQNGEVIIKNMGYPKITIRTEEGKITELIPCDTATLRIKREKD